MSRTQHKAKHEPRKVARKRELVIHTGAKVWRELANKATPKIAPVRLESVPFKSAWHSDSMKGESLGDLLRMLSTCRPHKSATVEAFGLDWLAPLGASRDLIGNWILRIGDSPVLWSSHTDTVHHKEGKQRLNFQPQSGLLNLARASRNESSCLGADCTVGVWLMREMIKANRPGLYVFHAGEERGGIGSSYIAQHTPELLKGIQVALAFDRRGTGSVITYQGWSRCCSDSFAESLSTALGMGHKADTGGVYTDTAEYVDLIPECSNLSVGYTGEHTSGESLDVPYLFALRDRLLTLDASALKIERKAGDDESLYESGGYGGRSYSTYGGYGGGYDWSRATSYGGSGRGYSNRERLAYGELEYDDGSLSGDSDETDESEALLKIIRWEPKLVAAYLESVGCDAVELADFIYERGGAVPNELFDYASAEREAPDES